MNFEETEVLYNVYRGILRNNRSFQPGKSTAVEYCMDCPEYADLLKKYPFEKIAGKGTDLQRAIRVLKYLSPKLTHSPWYDGHVDCNALALLDYSLDKPEQGINCLNKAKILEEVCLALGIYARRVRFLPYSPFDFDCHVVTEIYDRSQEKWCMLDPTTNGYLVDEQGTILSLLEARERMADTRFVTYCKATSREKDLQKLYRKNIARTAYYAKNLFRIQVDAVSQFGESGNWLNFPPEHFSIREWSVASAEYRLEMVPAYAKEYADFDEAVQLPRMREAVERTRNMEEPEAISAAALTPCTAQDLAPLRAGDTVLLSGVVYTARDQAHKRMIEALDRGEPLPFDLEGSAIYYVGPTPERPGEVIGSAGPTTSGRMDAMSPRLLDLGNKIMIGKGKRDAAVKEAVVRNGAVYLAALGGAGALMAKSVQTLEVIAWPDLGCEAVRRLTVQDMPLTVILDAHGGDLYLEGPEAYRNR